MPESDARSVNVPESDARSVNVPESDARSVDVPESDARSVKVPVSSFSCIVTSEKHSSQKQQLWSADALLETVLEGKLVQQ